MKHSKLGLFFVLVLALAFTGCAKKVSEDAGMTGTGIDSLSTTEELAQLPQSPSTKEPAAVEPLPVEAAPVSQAPAVAQTAVKTAVNAAAGTLSRDQQIQTALKNAGLYQGAIDGKIGPGSKRAIEAFQKNHGMKVDGKVGPKTWAALEAYLSGQAQAEPNVAPATEDKTSAQ